MQISGSALDFNDPEAFPDSGVLITNAGLSGGYSYSVKGDSLLITRTGNGSIVNYKLKKYNAVESVSRRLVVPSSQGH